MVLRNFPKTWAKRRAIMSKRRTDDQYIASWFRAQPVSFPANLPDASQTQGEKVADA
jgi:hypothetical protein